MTDFDISFTRSHFIRVEFGAMATKHQAVNLGQGFTDAPMPAFIAKHMADVAAQPEQVGWHQYTRSL
jgi:aspartate/methionine/tyrosine aminotransferase